MFRRMVGFTLVEMIAVIVITAVIAGGVAIFIRSPMQGYLDSVRRAALTDTADTALRRIARDLHGSLPNSVRVTTVGTTNYLEFLAMRTGGRYRANLDSVGAGDPLVFNAAATVFDTMSPLSGLADDVIVDNSDLVVIYNLGITGADAYNGDNTSVITGTGASQITFTSKTFPLTSPGNRFQVISGPVSYACAPGAALTPERTGFPHALLGLCHRSSATSATRGRDDRGARTERKWLPVSLLTPPTRSRSAPG